MSDYSPDVELDHKGRLVWARDVRKGDVISIPMHLLRHVDKQGHKCKK